MSHPLPTSACPDCGAALPPEQSLCPACLMRQALASRTVARDGDKTPQLPPPSPEEIADRFPGYEILECLGRGGMGAVYKARQKSLNRLVAIKILAPERVGEGRFAERFTIEAELLAKLGHPHIVTIHDFGETGGLFYLVMEFIDGVNLRDLLRDGKLESQQALAIVPPICDALQYAHDKGIVHRDIKPENILLDRDGRVKIADFGIASLVGASGENSGTPPYMAPEQSGGTVDRRADIYALGVVLYEMLTGERPEQDLVAPSRKVSIDVRIDEIVLRAMEKRPELRYQTADELRSVVDDFPAHSQSPSLPLPAPKRGMMRRWWWVFLVMIPLGPIIGLAISAGWASLVPKKYEAAAMIEIRPHNVEGMASPGWMGTEFEKLKSRTVLADVADQLDLPADWQVNRDEAVGILKGMITAVNIRGTDLMSVRVRHTNNEQAVDIANGVVSSYQRSFGGTVIVHDAPILTTFPVSPNVRLILFLGALGGLLLFPLMAVLLILILHRAFPEKNPSAEGHKPEDGSSRKEAATPGISAPDHRKSFFRSNKFRWILAVCLVAGVLWMALENSGRSYPVSSLNPAFKAPVMGRIEFIYTHAESHGMGASYASYDVKMWGDTQWKPSYATSITLKDGKSLWVKSRVNAMRPEAPIALVTTSSDHSNWDTKELEMNGEAPGQHLEFANGLRVEILWAPAPIPVNPEPPDPAQMQVMQQASKWSDEMHPVSRSKTVQITGEVTTKGMVELEEPVSLLDAMAAAGGWTEKSDLRNIRISMPGTTNAEIHDLTAILNGKAINPVIAPGSIIEIPEK